MRAPGRLRPGKRPVPNQAIAALTEILRPGIDLGKSRPEAPCLIGIGMARAQRAPRPYCLRACAFRDHPIIGSDNIRSVIPT